MDLDFYKELSDDNDSTASTNLTSTGPTDDDKDMLDLVAMLEHQHKYMKEHAFRGPSVQSIPGFKF